MQRDRTGNSGIAGSLARFVLVDLPLLATLGLAVAVRCYGSLAPVSRADGYGFKLLVAVAGAGLAAAACVATAGVLFGVFDAQMELRLPGPGRWGRRLVVLGATVLLLLWR